MTTRWIWFVPSPSRRPALLGATIDQVHAAARERATALGIGPGDRVLSTLAWTLPGGLADGLLAILAAPASLVHCAHPTQRYWQSATVRELTNRHVP